MLTPFLLLGRDTQRLLVPSVSRLTASAQNTALRRVRPRGRALSIAPQPIFRGARTERLKAMEGHRWAPTKKFSRVHEPPIR